MDILLYTKIVFSILLPAYLIYVISTIIHELSHKYWIKKYGVTILKNRTEVEKAGQYKDLSRLSFFMFWFEFKFLGASLHIKDREIEKLNYDKQRKILLAGIKSDIIFALTLILLAVGAIFLKEYKLHISIILLISIFWIVGKTYKNIVGQGDRGDLNQLMHLLLGKSN